MTNTRRRDLLVATGALFLAPLAAVAQQTGKLRRIGLLWIKGEGTSLYLQALRDGLRALGYAEGTNIQINERYLVDSYDQLPKAANDLVEENPEVIVTFGATATLGAYGATKRIPIVMTSAGDPVKLGVATSLGRPGKNVTGMTNRTEELNSKRLELLKEIVPGIRRVAVVYYPRSQSEVRSLQTYESAAKTLNLEVLPVEVGSAGEISSRISGIVKLNVRAIAFVGSTLFNANRRQMVAAVATTGLAAIYANSDYCEVGGLMAYGSNVASQFRRAAEYIHKVLNGANSGDLPIEESARFRLVINVKTAKALGLTVPQSLLLRADELIQ